jgi:hypothetical protein
LREAFENVESYLKNVWIDLHRTRWQQIVNKVDFSLKKPGKPLEILLDVLGEWNDAELVMEVVIPRAFQNFQTAPNDHWNLGAA